MSLSHVKPYFKARALELGWREWTEPFNVNNIPSTVIDASFNIELGDITEVQHNQYDLEIEFPVTVRYFRKGFRTPHEAVDQSILATESYIRASLLAENRLTGVGIKNVTMNSSRWVRFGASNDNLVMTEMQFTALVILAVD